MTESPSASQPISDSVEDPIEELTEPLAELSIGPWWWVLVRGILAIAFGVIALVWPANAAWAIAIVFGVYAIFDGVTEIVHAIRVRSTSTKWGWLLFAGIVSVLAGIAALILPGLSILFGGLFLIWTIVFYNIAHGAMLIGSAAGAEGKGKGWGIFSGVLSIVFGVILAVLAFVTPLVAILGLIFAVGIYAIIFGIMLAVAAIQARASGKKNLTIETV
jgi:uncharacterized membrane protein HdeD (DUF308 family)